MNAASVNHQWQQLSDEIIAKSLANCPVRIQLSRKKGFNLQQASMAINGLPAKSVCRPGKWGNPFVAALSNVYKLTPKGRRAVKFCSSPYDARRRAVTLYRELMQKRAEEIRRELAGHNLACWCPPGSPCHADVLLELLNKKDA